MAVGRVLHGGDVLTIWGGERDSKSYFSGTFSEDGDTNTGSGSTRAAEGTQPG